MSSVPDVMPDVAATSPRPRAATGPGSLLRAELGRLRRRRLVGALLLLGLVALLVAAAIVFFTHDRDVAGAQAQARSELARQVNDQLMYAKQCRADPAASEAQKNECPPETVDPSMTPAQFYQDPRLRADQGLPAFAIGIGVAGALLTSLVAATAVGADWSSRAIVTLLTWQPRRLRFLATRLGAVAVLAAVAGVLGQALGLGLGALTVATRGTFQATPPPEGGTHYGSGPGFALIGPGHFWRDLVLLQGRGVVLMVLAGVIAASLATITRSTGGFLGVALGWLVIVEVAGQGLLASVAPRLTPWTLAQSVAALLTPGGQNVYVGDQFVNGVQTSGTIQVSNLDGFWHLGLVAVVVTVVAGLLLKRRDL